jgi:drug/metabolite transporter (DMT)-like permease
LSFDVLAPIAILGAALSYAFAGVFGRRFKTMGVSPMATATGQVIASSILLAPLVMVVDQPWRLPIPSLSAWGALVGLATVSTALAYIIYFRVLESAGATNLLLVTFLIPVSAVLLGIGFLGEVLLSKHLLGMVLISIGLVAIDGRLWALFSSRSCNGITHMNGKTDTIPTDIQFRLTTSYSVATI